MDSLIILDVYTTGCTLGKWANYFEFFQKPHKWFFWEYSEIWLVIVISVKYIMLIRFVLVAGQQKKVQDVLSEFLSPSLIFEQPKCRPRIQGPRITARGAGASVTQIAC